MPPGQMHNFDQLRNAHGNVHFAGTATSIEWCGYMSGAIQSGYRGVAEILSDLQPAAVNQADLCLISSTFAVPLDKKRRVVQHKSYSANTFGYSLMNTSFLAGCLLGILITLHPPGKLWRLVQSFIPQKTVL